MGDLVEFPKRADGQFVGQQAIEPDGSIGEVGGDEPPTVTAAEAIAQLREANLKQLAEIRSMGADIKDAVVVGAKLDALVTVLGQHFGEAFLEMVNLGFELTMQNLLEQVGSQVRQHRLLDGVPTQGV